MKEVKADTHIHTKYSFDSSMKIKNIISYMEDKGAKYLAFTDHVEFSNQPVKEVIHRIEMRNKKIDELQEKTDIKLIKGIEVSEPHLYEKEMESLREIEDIDYILGSIHHILGMPIKKMSAYKDSYNLYLRSVLRMVKEADIDTLAHLDYLKKHISSGEFDKQLLEEVLNIIIAKGIALEINTSGYRRCNEYFPSNDILTEYASLGGKIVTYGSDAHDLHELGDHIPEAHEELKDYKFEEVVALKRRFRNI